MDKCKFCNDSGWVCEAHPTKEGCCGNPSTACDCGCGACMPCEECNPTFEGDTPRMPDGWIPDKDVN